MLFAFAGGHGHLQPLLPLARESVAAGHDVLVTGARALAEHVCSQGLSYAPSGPDLTGVRRPFELRDVGRERLAVGRHFAGALGRERGNDIIALAHDWKPDVVVCDEMDFGAAVAAEVLGLPHVTVVVLGAGGFLLPETTEEPLRRLRAAFNLPVEDGMKMLHRYLTLTPFPAVYRDPHHPLKGPVLAYRAAPPHSRPLSDVVKSDARQVYVTFGTIFNTESGDLLSRAVAGVAACQEATQVVVSTGQHLDPAELGPQPPNVTVRRFVPQHDVLACSAAVLCHGGSGTVLGALENGLPMVCIPLGADQSLNTRRCEMLGLGLCLPPETVRVDEITDAVREVLTRPRYRRAAEAIQAQVRALPDISTAVRAVESLIVRVPISTREAGRAAP